MFLKFVKIFQDFLEIISQSYLQYFKYSRVFNILESENK